MTAVDWERVMVRVRAHIARKSSHGRDELLREIAQIEADCEVPDEEGGYLGSELPVRRSSRHRVASAASHRG